MACRSEVCPVCFSCSSWRSWAVFPAGASVGYVGLSETCVRGVGASGEERWGYRALGPGCRDGSTVVCGPTDCRNGSCLGLVSLRQAGEGIMGNEAFGEKPAEAVGDRRKPPGPSHRGESAVIEMSEPLTGRIAVYGYKVIECKAIDRRLAPSGQPAAEIL